MRWLTSRLPVLAKASAAELMLAGALGTFAPAVLVLAVVFALHLGNDLPDQLEELDTATGALIFLWFWLSSLYWTLDAVAAAGLQSLTENPLATMLSEGIKRGAQTGMTFFVGLLAAVFLVVAFGFDEDPRGIEALSFLLFAVVYLVVGAAVAAIIGGALGFVYAIVFRILLVVASLVVGPVEAPEAAGVENA